MGVIVRAVSNNVPNVLPHRSSEWSGTVSAKFNACASAILGEDEENEQKPNKVGQTALLAASVLKVL